MKNNVEMQSNLYRTKITNEAFETICTKKDISDSIDELLGDAGEYLDMDEIRVYEVFGEKHNILCTFSWEDKHAFLEEVEFDYLVMKQFFELYEEEKLVVVQELGTDNELERVVSGYFRTSDSPYIVLSPIREDGQFKGIVVFYTGMPRRILSENRGNLEITVNVLATYLLKLRVVETIREKLSFIKNYDILTKIPTLHKFKSDLKVLLKNHPERLFAVVYLDFKNFKYINESIGEEAADHIMIDFGTHLKEHYSYCNCICRVESDRFLAVLPFTREEELVRQIHNNNEYFRHQMKEKSIVNNVTLCAGICPIGYEDDIAVVINNANLARKSIGEGETMNCKFFNQEMKDQLHRQLEIESCMEEALENKEFVLYLQPKIDLNSKRISGAEALVRWKRSEHEILSPNDFIPVFERNGFIVDLDYYMYEETCKILSKWREEERRIIPISVNVSRIHLNDDEFISKIKHLVESYNIPPSLLELEITETVFLTNKEVAFATMRELREYGFYVSIDDFGAGYSSLNLLKDMNTDVLKLDKEFFRSGTMNREDKIIVSSIVSMAKQLNMKVLSEGIETKSQSEFLQSIDCDMAQGYLFSKPVPLEEFEKMLIV